MTNEPLSDNEIIALTRKKFRQRKIGVSLFVVPAGMISGFAGVEFARGHLGHRPIHLPEILALGIAMLFALLGATTVTYFTRHPRGAYSTRILVKRVDELQWQIRRSLLVLALFLLPLLATELEINVIRGASHALNVPDYIRIFCFSILSLCALMMLTPYGSKRSVRPVLEDELTKTMRLRAVALGFWAAAPGLAALFALSLYDRNLAIEMMIPILYLAVAVPTLRFCYLDWRAARKS